MEANLSDVAILGEIYQRARPAITFNLAGYGVDPAERDQAISYRINATLVEAVCEAAARWRDPRWPGQHIVQTGSALEYGESEGDLREEGVARPTTLYGKSKLQGTQILAECCRTLGLRGLTARLFTVYGPGERAGRLLPVLIEASRTAQPVDLTEGTQRRDFTYVEDVAEGLLRLGLAAAEPGIVVNLATGRLLSVRTFVEAAAQVLGIPPAHLRFGVLPVRSEELRHDIISIDRLRGIVGWSPSTGIEEGIRRTVRQCKT
jgi:UDP-glucose 4-epimerase